MNKIVLKSALCTLAGLVIAAFLVFALWVFISPQTMATVCEKTGNYTFASTCAELRYNYTGDSEDLSRCVEDAILSDKDELIVLYGGKLIRDDGFDGLCVKKNASLSEGKFGEYTLDYASYICGCIAAAEYRAGNIYLAVEAAEKGGERSFGKLAIEVADRADGAVARRLKESLDKLEQTDYVKNLIEILNKI